ncbi:YeeE/YedE family protein [Metarhizium album ARSEF 1941]|uniref:YeeE/YedE family protein n=1 Tax=Metarhizium album (strain ARSEF 1941) TaxID=1081103 RepID=A0A0B2X0R5_METAS|nr:YeeE/YedE family protein [Metarhizium album ARSEF 1941]KHO02132.1 YeeE/YedE family protein [Metarhizium album ARSEF 1941]
MAATALSGAAFGAAMMAAGFHQPSVVTSQFKFEDWHMFQTFLAATASSAAIYALAERLGYVSISPRDSSPLGLFSKYDGNVLGGGLLGAGMALSGSCPGTLYAQLAAGVRSGFHALDGAIIGGVLWSGLVSKLVRRRRERTGVKPEPGVVSEQLRLSNGATLVLLEAVCVAVVAATTLLCTPASPTAKIAGALAGLLIGSAQLVSIVTRKTMLGVSGSYEEVGNFFWWLVGGADVNAKPASYQNILFASGVAAGAWGLVKLVPGLPSGPVREISPLLAVSGGVLMAVGSRMAGGCTSGHGISGISLLSTSSVITIMCTFAAGSVVAPLVH